MLSRLQELRKEEETLLRVKEALHDQLTRLKALRSARESLNRLLKEDMKRLKLFCSGVGVMQVHHPVCGQSIQGRFHDTDTGFVAGDVEELALRSMINTREGAMFTPSAAVMEEHVNMDNEVAINQTKLQLQVHADEEEEEEEESDS